MVGIKRYISVPSDERGALAEIAEDSKKEAFYLHPDGEGDTGLLVNNGYWVVFEKPLQLRRKSLTSIAPAGEVALSGFVTVLGSSRQHALLFPNGIYLLDWFERGQRVRIYISAGPNDKGLLDLYRSGSVR